MTSQYMDLPPLSQKQISSSGTIHPLHQLSLYSLQGYWH